MALMFFFLILLFNLFFCKMEFIDRLILELPSDPKPLMLTFHCLFPNDFLPALDILDRKLVHSVHCDSVELFLVTSTASSDRYEVRLQAWNCSCPTFALAAYRDVQTAMRNPPDIPYPFGGALARTAQPPVCKHILACVLHARCPDLFGNENENGALISKEELAGWCAGWGG